MAGQAEAEGRLALLAPGTVSVGDEGMCVPRNELPAPPPRACGLLPVETMGAASAKCLLCWGLSLGPRAWGGRL